MTKLITAEQAREIRSMCIHNFRNYEMEKYIKYINKKIREETKKGNFGFELWYTYYVSCAPDEVISELSAGQIAQLVNLLEENGYRAYLDRGMRLCVWWNEKPAPVIEFEYTVLPANKPWYKFWRKS